MSFEEIAYALSGPRVTIFYDVVERGPLTVGQVAARVGLALSTVSSHIQILCAAGLLQAEQDGRQVWVQALASDIELVVHWRRPVSEHVAVVVPADIAYAQR